VSGGRDLPVADIFADELRLAYRDVDVLAGLGQDSLGLSTE